MNVIHRSALAVLTSDWQPLPALRIAASRFNHLFPAVSGFGPNSGTWGFADLVEYGRAEEKREPVTDGRQKRGERSFYRLKP